MKKGAHIFLTISVHAFLWALLLIGIGIFYYELPPLFESHRLLFHFLNGLDLFFKWSPTIILSGVFLSFSWAFGSVDSHHIMRFSPILMHNFKLVLRVSILAVVFCFLTAEIFHPMTVKSREKMEHSFADFMWYENMAENSISRHDFTYAWFYNSVALGLAPKGDKRHKESLDFIKKLELASIEFKDIEELLKKERSFLAPSLADYAVPEGENAFSLLKKAREAFSDDNFFDAHYYASLAASICGDENPNRTEMLRLASVSWNALEQWNARGDAESMALFSQKKEGYTALSQNDVLKAYYTFKSLYDEYPSDPDIKRFFELSKELLNQRYFFIDETAYAKHFEIKHNVYFSMQRDDGGRIVVFIRGISVEKKAGETVQYLRNFTYLTYDKDNVFEMSCRVPFAKLTIVPSSVLGDAISIESSEKDVSIPVILLNAVSRTNKELRTAPIYEFGKAIQPFSLHYLILPVSFQDFTDACTASGGADSMGLIDLYKFSLRANEFGFSQEVFGTALLRRVCYPFVLLLVFIAAAVIGWNYRLSYGEVFRARWMWIFPLSIFICKFIIDIVLYGFSLLYFVLFGLSGRWSLVLSLFLFVFAIVLAGVRFLGLHGEGLYEESLEE